MEKSELEKKIEWLEQRIRVLELCTIMAPTGVTIDRCRVCGIEFKDAMGYVCGRSDCPSGIVCSDEERS